MSPRCCTIVPVWQDALRCDAYTLAPQTPFDVFSCPTPVNCGRMIQTRRKSANVKSHRGHGILTCNIEALCGVHRSIHDFVQNCIPTLALVVFMWHLDHDSATCKAVNMCSPDVVESQKLHVSGCPPVDSHAPTEHGLSTGGVAANVLLASTGVNSLTLLVSCRTSQGSDEWIRITLCSCRAIVRRWL